MANYCTPMIAAGSGSTLGYVEEPCYGVVPGTPVVKAVRRRSTTLGLKKETYASEEIRSDRQVVSSRHGARSVSGDIVTEISSGGHADFYEALLGGNWEQPTNNLDLTGAAVSFNIATDQIGLTGLSSDPTLGTAKILVGDTVRITGTTQAYFDNRLFLVVGTTPTGMSLMALTPTTATFSTPIASGNAKGQPRCSMGNIYRSFAFERAFDDIGSFLVMTGNRFNTAAIDLPPTGIATCTFGLIGQDAKPLSSTSIDGSAALVLTEATFGMLTGDSSNKTITASRAGASFITAGVKVGDKLILDGGAGSNYTNRSLKTVTKVTALTLTVAEAVRTGGTGGTDVAPTPWTLTRLGASTYDEGAQNNVLVAATGAIAVNGIPVATITGLTLNIDNQMAGSPTVGSNVVTSVLWGVNAAIGGNLTALFDRGGLGESLYNSFVNETDVSIYLSLVNAEGTRSVGFVLPRVKINTGDIGDAVAEGLPVSCDFVALKPTTTAQTRAGTAALRVTDTEVPTPAPVTLTAETLPAAEPVAPAANAKKVPVAAK